MQDNFRPLHLKHGRIITYRSDNEQPLGQESSSGILPTSSTRRPQSTTVNTQPPTKQFQNVNNHLNNPLPVQNLSNNLNSWLLPVNTNRNPIIQHFQIPNYYSKWPMSNYFNYLGPRNQGPSSSFFIYQPSWSSEGGLHPSDFFFISQLSGLHWKK